MTTIRRLYHRLRPTHRSTIPAAARTVALAGIADYYRTTHPDHATPEGALDNALTYLATDGWAITPAT